MTACKAAVKDGYVLDDETAARLVEQAFTECLYAGNNRELDALFEWYMSENGQEPLLKSAYLTLRSHMYFMGLRSLTDTAAEALKKAVWDLPKVGMLALLT